MLIAGNHYLLTLQEIVHHPRLVVIRTRLSSLEGRHQRVHVGTDSLDERVIMSLGGQDLFDDTDMEIVAIRIRSVHLRGYGALLTI